MEKFKLIEEVLTTAVSAGSFGWASSCERPYRNFSVVVSPNGEATIKFDELGEEPRTQLIKVPPALLE